MPSTRTIQRIQQIKDSVDRPEFCARLGNLEPRCSKRTRATRYIDGAVKIMDLIRDRLTADHLQVYKDLRERAVCNCHPRYYCGDMLPAARELWDYVLSLEQELFDKAIFGGNAHIEPPQPREPVVPPQHLAPVQAPKQREPIPVVPGAEPMNSWPPTTPIFFAAPFVNTYYHRPEAWVLLQLPVRYGGWFSPTF